MGRKKLLVVSGFWNNLHNFNHQSFKWLVMWWTYCMHWTMRRPGRGGPMAIMYHLKRIKETNSGVLKHTRGTGVKTMLCIFQKQLNKIILNIPITNGKYLQFQIDNCSDFHIMHFYIKTSHECQTMNNNHSTHKLWIISMVSYCVGHHTACTVFLCYLAINKNQF